MSQVRVLPAEPIKTRAWPETAGPLSISLCVRDSRRDKKSRRPPRRRLPRGVLPPGGREARFLTLAWGLPARRPAVVPERHARRGRDQSEKNSDPNHRPGSHRPCAPRVPPAPLIFREAQRLDRPFSGGVGSRAWRDRAGRGRGFEAPGGAAPAHRILMFVLYFPPFGRMTAVGSRNRSVGERKRWHIMSRARNSTSSAN